MQACSFANAKAVVVLGLGTLEPNILGNRLVGDVPAAAHEVAAPPQVPTPERRPQPPIILEEMMGGLPLNRLHDTARREMGWGAQQQMDMVGTHVALENFDVLTATDFPDQIPHGTADLPDQHRLAILRGEHEMVVQGIHSVGSSTQFAHGRPSYRKPPSMRPLLVKPSPRIVIVSSYVAHLHRLRRPASPSLTGRPAQAAE